jgi:hypothetical protein
MMRQESTKIPGVFFSQRKLKNFCVFAALLGMVTTLAWSIWPARSCEIVAQLFGLDMTARELAFKLNGG